MEKMLTGKVKWWDTKKGIGFIRPYDKREPEIFVHYSEIQGQEGRKDLAPGQPVCFQVSMTERGRQATGVVPDAA